MFQHVWMIFNKAMTFVFNSGLSCCYFYCTWNAYYVVIPVQFLSVIWGHYNVNLCGYITSFVDVYTLLLLCVVCTGAYAQCRSVCCVVSERTFCICLQSDSIFNLADYFSIEHQLNGMWTVLLENFKSCTVSVITIFFLQCIYQQFLLISVQFRMRFSPILHSTTVASVVHGASELRVKHDSFFNYL